jgi:hypothetical protein
MKVIITENKLRDLQLNYLNTMKYDYTNFDNFIILYYPDNRDDYELSEVMMEYDFEDNRLYVDNKFLSDFSHTYFPYEEDAQIVLGKWFEYKFGVEVKYMES